MNSIFNDDYKSWLKELKSTIQQSQIAKKQKEAKWGCGFIDLLSKNLKVEFPEMSGFHRTILDIADRFI